RHTTTPSPPRGSARKLEPSLAVAPPATRSATSDSAPPEAVGITVGATTGGTVGDGAADPAGVGPGVADGEHALRAATSSVAAIRFIAATTQRPRRWFPRSRRRSRIPQDRGSPGQRVAPRLAAGLAAWRPPPPRPPAARRGLERARKRRYQAAAAAKRAPVTVALRSAVMIASDCRLGTASGWTAWIAVRTRSLVITRTYAPPWRSPTMKPRR